MTANETPQAERPIGIDHLTLLMLTPPELVTLAADVGFAHVGFRVHAASAGEHEYPMQPGGPMMKETLRLLEATGVSVLDIENITLRDGSSREEWLPVLEIGAALGASFLNVTVLDDDLARAKATLADLAADALPFGVRPSIEPITYRTLNSVPSAAAFVDGVPGCGIAIDTLHCCRFGASLSEIASLGDQLTFVQICDGPAQAPFGLRAPAMPLGQSSDGSDLQIESRAKRQLPGEGEVPLRAILAAVPVTAPLAVEAPDFERVGRMGPRAFAVEAMRAARRTLSPLGGE